MIRWLMAVAFVVASVGAAEAKRMKFGSGSKPYTTSEAPTSGRSGGTSVFIMGGRGGGQAAGLTHEGAGGDLEPYTPDAGPAPMAAADLAAAARKPIEPAAVPPPNTGIRIIAGKYD